MVDDPKRLPETIESPPDSAPVRDPDLIADAPYAVVPTACQYCVVGCGYEAHLWEPGSGSTELPKLEQAHWVSPAMTAKVRYEGNDRTAAVVPDPKCSMNKGNHSPRGGTQGRNLVYSEKRRRTDIDSTRERLTTAYVRTRNGFESINIDRALDIVAELTKEATGWKKRQGKIRFENPLGLGVKLYEYQFLENTFAATKLFYQLIGTPNVAFHDRPSVSSNTQGFNDSGIDPHGYSYDDIWDSDVLFLAGNNPYENQSVFFMQYMAGKKLIVLDPRRTSTADYAEQTGGIHLQPSVPGADSLVLNALARYIRDQQRWQRDEDGHWNPLSLRWSEPWPIRLPRELVRTRDQLERDRAAAAATLSDEGPNQPRRARYRLSLDEYFDFLDEKFVDSNDVESDLYGLENAATVSGIPIEKLKQAARILAGPPADEAADLPWANSRKVSLIFEKGLIWGYCYQNTAAMANLGLLLGSVLRPGEEEITMHDGKMRRRAVNVLGVTGRAGGHQKGWGEVRYSYAREVTSPEASVAQGKWTCFTAGYPFCRSTDRFEPADGETFTTHHYFDAHLIGEAAAPRRDPAQGPEDPDIRLWWIVGSNALGQIGNAARKSSEVNRRRNVPDSLPESKRKPDVLRALKDRMRAGGLVVVQQDIYPNPTTTEADIILPAAGWGEENFTRYTGERRLRLYGKFQDSPGTRNARGQLRADREGNQIIECLPDWRIFQRIAAKLLPRNASGNGLPDGYLGTELTATDFGWKDSAEVFRDMAANSNRAGALGVLESQDQPQGHDILRRRGTEGVVLPLTRDDDSPDGIREHHRTPVPAERPYSFVKSDWTEIEADFRANLPRTDDGEFFLCNGRVNELWNSMFTHIRNDTVRQRWPDDMPGPVLEIHPDHAEELGVENGSVVTVHGDDIHMGGGGRGSFDAVASIQPTIFTLSDGEAPPRTAFVYFSYPASRRRIEEFPYREFTTEGYVNNITTGYVDPIIQIAAVKYARGTIEPKGTRYESDNGYLGPSYRPRNVSFARQRLPLEHADRQHAWRARQKWQMRELIVQRGLPRFRFPEYSRHMHNYLTHLFRDPDRFANLLNQMPEFFLSALNKMRWRDLDRWQAPYTTFAARWAASLGQVPEENALLALMELKLTRARRAHGGVDVDETTTLKELFQERDFGRILLFLQNGSYYGDRLVTPGDVEESEFRNLIQRGVMGNSFGDRGLAIVEQWIRRLPT